MARILPTTLALFLALASVCAADDGGMAAPGGGDVAAPAEPPAGVVETPAAETAPEPQATEPPADIGPYGPYHEDTSSAAAPVVPADSVGVEATTTEPATHTWPQATASAAEPPAPPQIVGSSGPGATAAVGESGGMPAWPLALGLAAFLALVIAAAAGLASHRPRRERNVLGPIAAKSSTRLA